MIWGGLHGIYLAAERGLRARLAWHPGPAGRVLLGLLTFVLTNLAWGFFRAKSFGQAGMILGSMFGHGTGAVPMMAAIYWRPGVRGPYDDVWKMQVANDERQAWLWPALEHDARLRAHARATWIGLFAFARPTPPLVAMTAARTRDAVARIRARGGEVVFVRPPSAPTLRAIEDRALPRAKGWDMWLRTAGVRGIHADDLPGAQGLVLPEFSHLTRRCARVFTDACVRALAAITPRIRIAPDAPPALTPADCTGGNGPGADPAMPPENDRPPAAM